MKRIEILEKDYFHCPVDDIVPTGHTLVYHGTTSSYCESIEKNGWFKGSSIYNIKEIQYVCSNYRVYFEPIVTKQIYTLRCLKRIQDILYTYSDELYVLYATDPLWISNNKKSFYSDPSLLENKLLSIKEIKSQLTDIKDAILCTFEFINTIPLEINKLTPFLTIQNIFEQLKGFTLGSDLENGGNRNYFTKDYYTAFLYALNPGGETVSNLIQFIELLLDLLNYPQFENLKDEISAYTTHLSQIRSKYKLLLECSYPVVYAIHVNNCILSDSLIKNQISTTDQIDPDSIVARISYVNGINCR